MRFPQLALRRHRAIDAAQLWAVFAFIALAVACSNSAQPELSVPCPEDCIPLVAGNINDANWQNLAAIPSNANLPEDERERLLESYPASQRRYAVIGCDPGKRLERREPGIVMQLTPLADTTTKTTMNSETLLLRTVYGTEPGKCYEVGGLYKQTLEYEGAAVMEFYAVEQQEITEKQWRKWKQWANQ